MCVINCNRRHKRWLFQNYLSMIQNYFKNEKNTLLNCKFSTFKHLPNLFSLGLENTHAKQYVTKFETRISQLQ